MRGTSHGYYAAHERVKKAIRQKNAERVTKMTAPAQDPTTETERVCRVCEQHPILRIGLCKGCLHAIEAHGSTEQNALECECDGNCGRYAKPYVPK